MIIAVDGGTTNTRLTLVNDGKVVDRIKCRVGVRNALRSGRGTLAEAVRLGIDELLGRNKLSVHDIRLAAFSGMIGSENGLYAIEHITAPAGIDELRRGTVQIQLPGIADLPFLFIPGVKTFTDPLEKPLGELDIMRGEETELMGILSSLNISEPLTVLLPGSHMKIVDIDASGRITAFRTSLSGELIRAAAENTILSQSLGDVYPTHADENYLRQGYEYAERRGINEALFKIRVQANFIKKADAAQLYAFLMGAILRDDVRSVLDSGAETIVVGGSDPFRSALAELIGERAGRLIVLSDESAEQASALGAELICRDLTLE